MRNNAKAITGVLISLIAIWGGAYFKHLFADSWCDFPILATSLLTGLTGLVVFVNNY